MPHRDLLPDDDAEFIRRNFGWTFNESDVAEDWYYLRGKFKHEGE